MLESNSNKCTFHSYGAFYDAIFASLLFKVGKPLRVLEIGVSYFGEGSGHAFSKMPYVGKFVGVDVRQITGEFGGKGVFVQGNAYHTPIIEAVSKHGPFHLIIDDGDHNPRSQRIFLELYPPLACPVSAVICEDVMKHDIPLILSALQDETICAVHFGDALSQANNMLVKMNG